MAKKKAVDIKAINIDEVQKEALEKSGVMKDELNDVDKENLELYYKVEQGRGFHEAKLIKEREEYIEKHKEELERERLNAEFERKKEREEQDLKQEKAIKKSADKFNKTNDALLKLVNDMDFQIMKNLDRAFIRKSRYTFGVKARGLNQPSMIIDGEVAVSEKRYKPVYIELPFGYYSITNQPTNENIKKDIKDFTEQLEKAYEEVERQVLKALKI